MEDDMGFEYLTDPSVRMAKEPSSGWGVLHILFIAGSIGALVYLVSFIGGCLAFFTGVVLVLLALSGWSDFSDKRKRFRKIRRILLKGGPENPQEFQMLFPTACECGSPWEVIEERQGYNNYTDLAWQGDSATEVDVCQNVTYVTTKCKNCGEEKSKPVTKNRNNVDYKVSSNVSGRIVNGELVRLGKANPNPYRNLAGIWLEHDSVKSEKAVDSPDLTDDERNELLKLIVP